MDKQWSLIILLLSGLHVVANAVPADSLQDKARLESRHQIFENLYGEPHATIEKPGLLTIKQYKERLKATFALQFNDHLQIGVDSVKAKSFKGQKNEIIALEPHLAPKGGQNVESKGYGVEVKFKLD